MKALKKLLIVALSVFLPVGGFLITSLSQKPLYADSFYGEFPSKYERLTKAAGKKIVFVGASSLPFGIRSDLIESELPGYQAVDMGLYVPLKSKATLTIALNHLCEGDVLVFAPEPVTDMYTSEFAKKPLLQAIETKKSIYWEFSEADRQSLLASSFEYGLESIRDNAEGKKYTSADPYNKASFNEYGEIKEDLITYNEMALGYDPSLPVDYSSDLLTSDYLDYLATVQETAHKKKASFFYSFSPLDQLAFTGNAEGNAAFEKAIQSKLGDCLLNTISDSTYEYGYFYDTNFHLNASGRIKHSVTLINALKKRLGVTAETTISVPSPSGTDPNNVYKGEEDNTFEAAFDYEESLSGLAIKGIKDEYKHSVLVSLPTSHNGETIVEVKANAFAGCNLLAVVRIGGNIRLLGRNAFASLPKLERVEIYNDDPNKIAPPAGGRDAMFGTGNALSFIYVHENVLATYQAHYNWSTYKSSLRGM